MRREAILIQEIDQPRKIDSSGTPVGFDCCALGGYRRLLQQYLPKGDIVAKVHVVIMGASVAISA
jgi:hypothetical protein